MKNNRKKLNIKYRTDTELEIAGYYFAFWKLGILGAALLIVVLNALLMLDVLVKVLLLSVAFGLAGFFAAYNLFLNIRSGRILCDSLFIVLAAVIVFAIGEYTAAALIFIFYDVMRFAESWLTDMQTAKAGSMLDILPDVATVIVDGVAEEKKPKYISYGDIVGVRAGETVPVDGEVLQGVSSVDYSALTRSTRNVDVSKGMTVLSGGVNLSQPLLLRAKCDYSDSVAQRIWRACSSSVKTDTDESFIIRRVLSKYVPITLILAFVVGLIIPIFTHNWAADLKRACAILLLGCPYGFFDFVSLAIFTAIENIFASGAIVRDSSILNLLSSATTFICNKTGTLTENEFEIEDVYPIGISIDNFLSLVTKVESVSNHPAARALRKYTNTDVEIPEGMLYEEIPGKGIKAQIAGNSIIIGNARLLYDNEIETAEPKSRGSIVHVAVNGKYCGYIAFINRVRKGCSDALEAIRSRGLKNFALLSCDLQSSVRVIGQSLGFNVVKAEIDAKGKADAVEYLMSRNTENETCIYLGNGCDELESSSLADVSVATDAFANYDALDSADVCVLGAGLSGFADVLSAASRCRLISRSIGGINLAIRLVVLLMIVFNKIPLVLVSILLSLGAVAGFLCSSLLFERF